MKTISYLLHDHLLGINSIIDTQKHTVPFLFATRNQHKLAEYRRILGKDVEGIDLQVPEIQDSDPVKVAQEKAKAAYYLYGGPIFVEDSSLTLPTLDNMIGPFADNETNSKKKLEAITRMFGPQDERTAIVGVTIAVFDGSEIFSWTGEVRGTISENPIGGNGFGFDPIFIPKGATQTYAQMTDKQKDAYSPRKIAAMKLLKNPVRIIHTIFPLQEPSGAQLDRIQKEELTKYPKALQFAFSLDVLSHVKPNASLKVEHLLPFYKISYANGSVLEYKANPKSASMGLVIIPEVDLKLIPDHMGESYPLRLDVEPSSQGTEPFFLQMGPQSIAIALASRAAEYIDMHNDEIHQYVRDLASGKVPVVARSNTRSGILEEILDMKVHTNEHGIHSIDKHAGVAIATKEVGYKMESHDGKLSRKAATKGVLLLGPDGIVSSVYAYGGIPP